MKVALLTTDNREPFKQYNKVEPWFGTAPEALLQGFAQLPEVEVHVVSCIRRPVKSPEKIAPNIFFHSLVVPKLGWMSTLYQGCIRATRKKLRDIQPDIVHGQGTELDSSISAVLSGFPNIVTIHGHMGAVSKICRARVGSFLWLAARLEEFTLPRTAGVICISDYVRDLVKKHHVPTWIVPNAVQGMFFDFPKSEAPANDRPLLINVGVISERKRQQQVLAILESLREEGFGFDTLFIGVSPGSTYATTFTNMLGQANRKYGGFKHIQKLDDASFCRQFDQAAAMIHFSNEESFGLTFAEAIARGVYLFASDVGAIRDIAKGVERVQMFGLDKWGEMKNSVRHWLATEQFKLPKPANPPPEFCQRYQPAEVARRHLEIYRKILNKK
ncbi:MAG: glycosyltransferase family 4 protein [Verrucomicrobiota bacterium]